MEKIYKGFEMRTFDGGLKVTGCNVAGLVYLDEYTADDDGNLTYTGERRLTLNEVAGIMGEMDGRNHKVKFVWRYQVEYTDPETGAKSPIDNIEWDFPMRSDDEKDLTETYRETWGNGEITFTEIEN